MRPPSRVLTLLLHRPQHIGSHPRHICFRPVPERAPVPETAGSGAAGRRRGPGAGGGRRGDTRSSVQATQRTVAASRGTNRVKGGRGPGSARPAAAREPAPRTPAPSPAPCTRPSWPMPGAAHPRPQRKHPVERARVLQRRGAVQPRHKFRRTDRHPGVAAQEPSAFAQGRAPPAAQHDVEVGEFVEVVPFDVAEEGAAPIQRGVQEVHHRSAGRDVIWGIDTGQSRCPPDGTVTQDVIGTRPTQHLRLPALGEKHELGPPRERGELLLEPRPPLPDSGETAHQVVDVRDDPRFRDDSSPAPGLRLHQAAVQPGTGGTKPPDQRCPRTVRHRGIERDLDAYVHSATLLVPGNRKPCDDHHIPK
ncbi:hypothetical protein F8144_17040 [Streptomyces triticiradicis]|uniref:Uncharacterized protein n=1 Tax=Streptomyces triticiradicis TaxID=2651189 RepID=A0A7J5DFH5_9ACTN|nr:hypothetical protein F8144_17040 [Streptomyces triticiradicis]